MLTHEPESDAEFLQRAADDPASVASPILEGKSVLDLCSGSGTVSAAAQGLGAHVVSVDNHPIPVLIGHVALALPSHFGAPDPRATGSSDDATWSGLAVEMGHWSHVLVNRVKEAAGAAWLDDCAGLLRAHVLRCEACGHEAPAARTLPMSDEFTIERGTAVCPACGHRASYRHLVTGMFATRFVVALGRGEPVPAPIHFETTFHSPGSRKRLDDLWVVGTKPMTFGECLSPRQAELLRAMQDAFRSIRDELADTGYSPGHASAVLTSLALGLSSLVDRLTTMTQWDARRHVARGLDRQEWIWSPEFFEMSGLLIETHLARRFRDLAEIIGSGGRHGSFVDVRSEDMRAIKSNDGEFEIVVWDPPFYDNIDYERLALPFTRFLRSLIGDVYPQLRWPQDLAASASRSTFDAVKYDEGLREATAEIARVLRPGGRLGVFWIAQSDRTADNLRGLLEVLQPNGLELIQSVALRTEVFNPSVAVEHSARRSVFLVFRRTPSARPADAESVLEGALAGRRMVYGGLVDLLRQHLDEDEIEAVIPAGYRGTIEQRLLEAVLSHPEPRDLLSDIPKKALRSFVEERTATDSDRGRSREQLEDDALRVLGWQVPHEPRFSVGSALDEAEILISQLRLATTENDIRGAATAAFDRIEQILRFTVASWATWLRGEAWEELLVELVQRNDRLTLGQWLRAFIEIPGHCARENELIGQINAKLRRAKVSAGLDAVVKVRNGFAHPDGDRTDWLSLRDESVPVIQEAIRRLRTADEDGALPQVLQPASETRDPYGRITLRLVGHQGHVEFLMTEPSDLTHPIVFLRGQTNPREVDPVRIRADLIAERAGVSPS
jgi:SAM-dependent methyltransferase